MYCVHISKGERGRLSAPVRDVIALTTPGLPQWPFLEGADALAPLTTPRSTSRRLYTSPRIRIAKFSETRDTLKTQWITLTFLSSAVLNNDHDLIV